MVVRLKDLESQPSPSKTKGVVRLKDIQQQTAPAPVSRPTVPVPSADFRKSPILQGASKMTIPEQPQEPERPGRDIPVIGPVLRGLDYVGEAIEPAVSVARSFYTPGAGLGAISAGTQAVEGAIAKVAPKLVGSLGGRVAQKAITEGVVGVPVAAGQSLTNNTTDLGEVAKEGLIGGALGAGIGALGPLAKKGLTRLKDLRKADVPAEIPVPKADPLRPQLQEEVVAGQSLAPESAPDIAPLTERKGPVRLADLTGEAPTPSTVAEPSVAPETVTPPRVAIDGKLPHKHLETLSNSPKATPEFVEGVKGEYKVLSNEETVAKANQRVSDDMEKASSYVLNANKFSAEHVATAHRLIDEFQKAGNIERAVDIAQKASRELTKAGQTVQAASIYNRLTPEGVLIHAQRAVDKVNESLPKFAKEVKLTTDMAAELTDLAGTVQNMAGAKSTADNVMNILERAKAGQTLSETETKMIQNFVKDARQFVKSVEPKVKEARPPKAIGDNRVKEKVVSFLDAQEQAAKERLRAKGIRISSMPLDVYTDYAIIGAAKLAKGTIKFAEWSADMVKDFGDEIRPHLEKIYHKAQETWTSSAKKITDDMVSNAENSAARLSGGGKETDELATKLSEKVKTVIENAKSGNLADGDLQDIRDLADELADLLPESQLVPADKKYLQTIKSLSKKLAGVESKKAPVEQDVKEVQKLLSTIAKLADEGKPPTIKTPIDATAIEDLGYQLMERTKPRAISEQEKIAEKFIKKSEERLTEQDIETIRGLAQKVSGLAGDAKTVASQDLQYVLNQLERPGVLKKISSAQTIAQLLNPKTLLARNPIGNELFYRLERMNKLVATPIDWTRSKITGGPRTVTFSSGDWRNFFMPTADFWTGLVKGAKAGWRGVNPDGISTQFDISGPAFRAKWNPLTYMEKALGATLKGFDYAAYKRTVNQTMREMAHLDAINKGLKGNTAKQHMEQFLQNADDNLLAIADKYGKYITLQDNNVISKGLSTFKRGLNLGKDFGLGDLILKYPKTPGAIIMRAIEYSPAGILRSAYILAKPWLNKSAEKDISEATLALSRAIVGTTGLTGLGWFLADQGVITGSSSKDKDIRELAQMAGQGQYQVNLSALKRWVQGGFDPKEANIRPGDRLINYDWAQPVAIAISIGANIDQNRKQHESKGKAAQNLLGTAYSSLEGGLNTITEQSVLKGVKDAFASAGGPNGSVGQFVKQVASGVPASFAPTLGNQINQAADNKKRETYDPNPVKQAINRLEVKVPGLAQKLPQAVNTLGQPKENYQNNSLFNVFLNPSFTSKYKLTPEAELVVKLINDTGEGKAAPRAVDKYIMGKKDLKSPSERIDLTPQQYVRLQTLTGEETTKRLRRLNPNMSNDNKLKAVVGVLNDAGDKARTQLKKELGVK